MAEVWSAETPFCPRCGTLLVFPDVGDVVCDKCDYSCRMQGARAATAGGQRRHRCSCGTRERASGAR
jgi:uncharacterized Zn finger protein (UPF0148 family)